MRNVHIYSSTFHKSSSKLYKLWFFTLFYWKKEKRRMKGMGNRRHRDVHSFLKTVIQWSSQNGTSNSFLFWPHFSKHPTPVPQLRPKAWWTQQGEEVARLGSDELVTNWCAGGWFWMQWRGGSTSCRRLSTARWVEADAMRIPSMLDS